MATVYGKSLPLPAPYAGIADFVVDIPAGDRPIRILQLTDMQVIDASQQRRPDRLNEREIAYWQPESIDVQCFDHIRTLVAETLPDLIFITGDVVYGEFDDSGRFFIAFRDFMDSLGIPWAPVYGNHDTSSQKGVFWQNEQWENGPNCLFKTGKTTGNGNYSVLITRGGAPVRVLYMMDSHGDGWANPPEIRLPAGLYPDQMAWFCATAAALAEVNGGVPIPAFMGFHIPSTEFVLADRVKGYDKTDARGKCILGVTVPCEPGDFGARREPHAPFRAPEGFLDDLHAAGVDGVFVGHCHGINTSVVWEGIRWTYGLKTGQYDFHIFTQQGGTLITQWGEGARFDVCHTPSTAISAPVPNPELY